MLKSSFISVRACTVGLEVDVGCRDTDDTDNMDLLLCLLNMTNCIYPLPFPPS